MIHPASGRLFLVGEVKNASKAGARALLYSIKRKEPDLYNQKVLVRRGQKALAERTNGLTIIKGWQSQPLPPNIKGPMVRGPRHMTEIKRLGSANSTNKGA